MYRTENRLSVISFKDEDILKIIKLLNVNKAYGHNNISIKLLQICAAEVVKTLSLISKGFIQYGLFSNLWKKSNIVPIHKKGNKQFMVNYCPVLLLPICEKIFERLVLSGQSSNWSPILAGILHGSILGSLLFLVYINDFPYNLES